MRKRWEVVSRDVDGREIDVTQFMFKRAADAELQMRVGWASVVLAAGYGPLYTNEVRRTGEDVDDCN